MSAKDRFHDAVKTALQKDGWTITQEPLTIRISPTTNLYIDLGAERILAAERAGQKIAVEVKSFLSASAIADFHMAIGQYTNYRYAITDFAPEWTLYLAVPLDVYDDFFTQPFIQSVIQRSQVNLLIYDAEKEEVVRWQS